MSSVDPTIIYINAVTNDLNLYFPIILISIGTLGNLITFIIYTRADFRKTSIGFYYSCLAVVDTIALYVGSIKYYINAKYDLNLTTESVFACKFFTGSIYFLAQLSAWLTVIASIDRLFSIVRPLQYSLIRRNKLQYIMVAAIFVVLVILNVPNFIYLSVIRVKSLHLNSPVPVVEPIWFESVPLSRMIARTEDNWNRNSRSNTSSSDSSSPVNGEPSCEIDSSSSIIYNTHVADILDLFAFAILPFLLMIFSSIIITKRLFEIKSNLRKHNLASKAASPKPECNVAPAATTVQEPENTPTYMNSEIASISANFRRQSQMAVLSADTGSPSQPSSSFKKEKKIKFKGNSGSMKKEYQVSLTIIGMNVFFLLLNLPVSLTILILNVIDAQLLMNDYDKAVGILIFTIANILSYFHFATPFFVHYSLNRNFRSKLRSFMVWR